MSGLPYYLVTAIVLVTMISILVAAHELGHYLFARLFNMGVEEFSIGFGSNPIMTWMRKTYTLPLLPGQEPVQRAHGEIASDSEHLSVGSKLEGGVQHREYEVLETDRGKLVRESTNFTIRPWPLGGFVRIKGMLPEEDGGETRIAGGFYSKPPWQRLIVLLAGPLFSVLAGVIILVPLFMWSGIDKPVMDPVISSIVKNGPADRAGIKPGDRVVSIDGQPIHKFYDMLQIVTASAGKHLQFVVDRNGQVKQLDVVPVLDPESNLIGSDLQMTPDVAPQGKILAAWDIKRVRLAFPEALAEAMQQPVDVVKGIGGMLVRPKRFSQQVSGPATIARITGTAVTQGFDKVLWLAAMLSISVGIMNLLPMPPLDGGQIVVALAEMLRGGRRLSLRIQNAAAMIGVAAVFALMLGALYIDMKRIVDAPQRDATVKKMLQEAAADNHGPAH